MNLNLDLLSSTSSAQNIKLRSLDFGSLAGELSLRIEDVNARVAKLEEAQIVSQAMLEAVVSV